MNEDFLHYVWKFQLFDKAELKAASGERIEIIRAGEHNYDSGPDFFNAQIKINGTLWAGNVEIHINSSDWNKHKHFADKAYDNVILHVVFNNDAENHVLRLQPKNTKGDTIPEIELKFRILPGVQKNYELLQKSSKSFACAGIIKNVKEHTAAIWLERMAIERMEEKQQLLEDLFASSGNNWDVFCYYLLAKNFGFKTNADAFLSLAQSLPLTILQKHANDVFQLESLLFGQSGLLDDYLEDEYAKKLQNEYAFLKKKYSLVSLKKENWKFLKMRPVNFSTIRIAQFAALISKSPRLFSVLIEQKNAASIKQFLSVTASSKWDTRYSFTTSSNEQPKVLGDEAMENIIINTIAPLLFFYGRKKDDEGCCDLAVELMAAVPPENNKITREYQSSGFGPASALQSQGMLHMNKNYCKKSACLKCAIGNDLIKG